MTDDIGWISKLAEIFGSSFQRAGASISQKETEIERSTQKKRKLVLLDIKRVVSGNWKKYTK